MDLARRDSTPIELEALLAKQRDACRTNEFPSAATRIDRLARARALVYENQSAIVDATHADFGGRSAHQTRMGDVYATLESLDHARKHVARWMKPSSRKMGFPAALIGARGAVEFQPKGVVGILGTWNFPVNTVFAPLAGVLAAGNSAILKFSEIAPRTARLMEELVARRFDASELACVAGGPDVGRALASMPFDHLVFTGSTAIGREILRAAANHLTPVTLELGGKSPVVIAPDADLALAAVRVMTGKALNSGQACLAPDFVLVPDALLEGFVGHASAWWSTMFPRALDNPDYTSVIDARHHRRLTEFIDEARAAGADVREVNPAAEDFATQRGSHKIPLTIVVNPADGLRVKREELFGPVLVVETYAGLDDCLARLDRNPRPLGLYLFSDDVTTQRRLVEATRSGGVTINDVMTHVSVEDMPFGGIGPSGMGCYHGRDGFETFSHPRPVYRQSRINLQRIAGMIPPYGAACDGNLGRMIRK